MLTSALENTSHLDYCIVSYFTFSVYPPSWQYLRSPATRGIPSKTQCWITSVLCPEPFNSSLCPYRARGKVLKWSASPSRPDLLTSDLISYHFPPEALSFSHSDFLEYMRHNLCSCAGCATCLKCPFPGVCLANSFTTFQFLCVNSLPSFPLIFLILLTYSFIPYRT